MCKSIKRSCTADSKCSNQSNNVVRLPAFMPCRQPIKHSSHLFCHLAGLIMREAFRAFIIQSSTHMLFSCVPGKEIEPTRSVIQGRFNKRSTVIPFFSLISFLATVESEGWSLLLLTPHLKDNHNHKRIMGDDLCFSI